MEAYRCCLAGVIMVCTGVVMEVHGCCHGNALVYRVVMGVCRCCL